MSEKDADCHRGDKSPTRVCVDRGPYVIRDRLVVGEKRPALVDEGQQDHPEEGGDQPREKVADSVSQL
jgi:hypothetical protein